MYKQLRKTGAAAAIAGLLMSALPVVAAGGPSVTLSSTSLSPTGDTPIMVTATVSTSTVWFNGGLVQVQNGSLNNFSGSGTSYSFEITPNSPNDPDPAHRLITVVVPDNAFESNDASNMLTFQFDSSLTPVDTTAPVITFVDPSPAEGGVVASSSVTFAFVVDDASSTLRCSVVGQSDMDNFYSCGSPQTFSLPNGAYRFAVEATDTSSNMASSSRLFSVAISTSTDPGDTGTTTATSTPETPSTGGGGSSAPAPAPSGGGGGGNSPAGGPPAGHAVIPTLPSPTSPTVTEVPVPSTSGNAVIPTVPVATTPVVSQSSGGSALVGSNTPGVPNTGADDVAQADDITSQTTTSDAATPDAYNIPTTSLGAAAATADSSIPGWVWLVLAGIILIGVGVWALRQPVV